MFIRICLQSRLFQHILLPFVRLFWGVCILDKSLFPSKNKRSIARAFKTQSDLSYVSLAIRNKRKRLCIFLSILIILGESKTNNFIKKVFYWWRWIAFRICDQSAKIVELSSLWIIRFAIINIVFSRSICIKFGDNTIPWICWFDEQATLKFSIDQKKVKWKPVNNAIL